MNTRMQLQTLLMAESGSAGQRLALFALLSLGVIESLANGLVSAADALGLFFHADNCLYVRKHLRAKSADEIMGRGVQLADLFDTLPAKEAQQEFQRELTMMRSLCLKLLEDKKRVA